MAFSDPRKIVGELFLREGMRVADFGSGSGYYTLAAAQIVTDGRVYAVDIQKELLARLKNEASRLGLSNIDIVWGDIDETNGSRLASATLDVVILANVLFQIEHRQKAAKEVMRVLKPKGRVLVVDWADSFGGLGPKQQDVISPKIAQELFEGVGFTSEGKISDAGDHHYGLIFKKE